MSQCPCGSKTEFSACCEPYLKGTANPPTAEKLMRARYSAFATGDIDYIEQSTDPESRKTFDRPGTEEWAKSSEWLGLEIIRSNGTERDTTGEVEFTATYQYKNETHVHHELSSFHKHDGKWYFFDGKLVQEPVRSEPKVGRNDPCPCGSGKKYKKCCAA